jgi:AraC family transcriptional activator of mtrCDE
MHERLLRSYLPERLVVNTAIGSAPAYGPDTGAQLAALVGLMRMESSGESLGGHAILTALSATLFALTLRLASQAREAPAGLLALASQPRLAPALNAMINQPGHAWTVVELAGLCGMSRATFIRHFGENMGRSATDLLTEIRMMLAASEIRHSSGSTASIAEAVGYKSEAAFQRAFKQHVGVTPARWRREGKQGVPGKG